MFHHIRMISEVSCDTEDWRNDAEKSPLITVINYTTVYSHRKGLFEINIKTVILRNINQKKIGEQKRLLLRTNF